jgi:hypothetical protein
MKSPLGGVSTGHEDEAERLIHVDWGVTKSLHPVRLSIEAWDRVGLLRDITTQVSEEKVNIAALVYSHAEFYTIFHGSENPHIRAMIFGTLAHTAEVSRRTGRSGWWRSPPDQIDREEVTFPDGPAVYFHRAGSVVDIQSRASHHAGLAHASGHHCCMGGSAAFAGQDAFCCKHAMHIVRFGKWPHHDDILSIFFCHAFGSVCIEVNLPHSGTWRGIHPRGVKSTFSFGR